MTESVKTGRSDVQMNKAKLKIKQVEAQARAERIKQLVNRPKPRVQNPSNDQ